MQSGERLIMEEQEEVMEAEEEEEDQKLAEEEKKKKKQKKKRKNNNKNKKNSKKDQDNTAREEHADKEEHADSRASSPTHGSIHNHLQLQTKKREKPFNCNLDRFLESTCPAVQAQTLPRSCAWESCRVWQQNHNANPLPFFTLGDLWDSFTEWSAYGVGVPISLKGHEAVVQYYVPSLSALQLYTRSRRCSTEHGNAMVPNCAHCECGDSCSNHDGTSEALGTCCCNKLQKIYENDRVEFEEQPGTDSQSAHEWHPLLLFEYFESSPPYSRIPLSDKIAQLAEEFPELRSLRSVDLLPASWVSIAWYPIYRIPIGPTLRESEACFLTFHSLSTSLQDGELWGIVKPSSSPKACTIVLSSPCEYPTIYLKPFGLAHYKLRGSIWTSVGNPERRHAASMYRCAEYWLSRLHVGHPDFDFFQSHNPLSTL